MSVRCKIMTKKTIRRLASEFFLSGGILYKKAHDLVLLKCVNTELHAMFSPWPFMAWRMDVIGTIEPKTSNGHRFILVAIDFFTKWVEALTFKSVTKKAVVDFIHFNIIRRFGIPKMIVIDDAINLKNCLMQEVCHQIYV